MICPNCSFDNLPGSEDCARCHQDLTQLDVPIAQDRVQRSLMEDPVSVLGQHVPITVRPNTPIHEAIQTMLTHNIGALLVTDEKGKLVGILSERDLLTKVAGEVGPTEQRPVRDFMTRNPETVVATDTLAFALGKMDGGGYRHLPVVQDGRPTSVISVRDVLTHFTRMCNG
jgi:CBS domain-containing protein